MEATKKLNGKAVGKWLSNNAIIMMMLAVTLIVGIIHPNFFSGTNMINLFKNVSIRYIIALGISGCLITTGNDLSAGRLAGFAACLACIFAQTEGASGKFYPNMPTLPTPVVFVLVIAICAIVGLCNGLVVSYLKVQPFIATLGMQQVVYGICLVYTGGTPIGSLNSNFTALAKDTFLATVERYNELYDKQNDEDFGKPAYRLSAIRTAPFYGCWLGASLLCSMQGISNTENCQAKDSNNEPIPGLYITGDMSGSFFANNYPCLMAGVAMGRTLTYAMKAVKQMAGLENA